MLKQTLLLFFLIFLSVLAGCAKSSIEKIDDDIDKALFYLTDGPQCQEAIDLLETLGRQNTNSRYIQTLASAYGCRANYSELTLFDEISTIVAGVNTFLPGLAKLSSSLSEHAADSASYTDILTSMNILLYAGNLTTSSATQRESVFGISQGSTINLQILYEVVVQLGKFVNFYGNANAAGAKGQGAANVDEQGATPSSCFFKYTDSDAQIAIQAGFTGVCDSLADTGHPNLDIALNAVATKRRMCEGLVLFTNLVDLLNNTTLPDVSELEQIDAQLTTLNTAISLAPARLTNLLAIKDQAACVAYVTPGAGFDELQLFYAYFFETGLP